MTHGRKNIKLLKQEFWLNCFLRFNLKVHYLRNAFETCPCIFHSTLNQNNPVDCSFMVA